MGLAVPHLELLALGAGHRRARNGGGLASQGLLSFLNLEGAARPHGQGNQLLARTERRGESQVSCRFGNHRTLELHEWPALYFTSRDIDVLVNPLPGHRPSPLLLRSSGHTASALSIPIGAHFGLCTRITEPVISGKS
jgi:hypothetical protein